MTPSSSWSRCPFCGTRLDPTQSACPQCGAAPSAAVTVGYDERRPTTPAELQALETELRDALAPRLQLLRLLGQGGMGSVFLARDPALRRLVVVKVLSPTVAHDPVARARFAREAETAASVAHPNVVHVYQVGALDRSATTYFTMQFVDGMTLEQAFPPGTPTPEPVAKRIVGEIASALAAAHARDLIHRDIKPANVMIDRESGRALVLDFGISAAKRPDSLPTNARATVEGMVVGTPAYMSPEQAAGEPSIDRSDIYSLGVVAFELVTGRSPFTGSTPMALVAAHLRDIPPPVATIRPELDPQFAGLIDQCLLKEAAARPSAESIARYLAPPIQARVEWPPPGLERLHGRGWRFLRRVGLGSIVVEALLLLLATEPSRVTGAWYHGNNSLIWELTGNHGIGTFHFLLFGSIVFTTGLALMVAVDAWFTAQECGRARRSGYPWSVVLDVACDHLPATSDLLTRQGSYALLDPAAGERLWRQRRWRLACVAGAIVLGFLNALLWWWGLLTFPDADPTAVISPRGLVILLALPLLPLLAGLWLGRAERRIRRKARHAAIKLGPPPVRPELVGAWLASAGVAAPPPRKWITLPTIAVAELTTVMIVALVALIGAVNMAYFLSWSDIVEYSDRSATTFLMHYDLRHEVVKWWPRVDSTLAALPPIQGGSVDSGVVAARRLLTLGVTAHGGARTQYLGERATYWALDPAPPDSLRARYPGGPPGNLDVTLWDRLTSPLTPAEEQDLQGRAHSPRTRLGALVAGSPTLPMGWSVRLSDSAPISGFSSGYRATPASAVGRALFEPLQGFEAAAILAVRRGDRHTATAQLDLAAGYTRVLLREPADLVSDVGLNGLTVLQRMAERLSTAFDDLRMTRIAQRLGLALAEHRATIDPWGIAEDRVMADPEDPAGFDAMVDPRIYPGTRILLFEAIARGVCQNPREVLFGVTPDRFRTIERAAAAMRDLPVIDDLATIQRRRLTRVAAMTRGERMNACLGKGF